MHRNKAHRLQKYFCCGNCHGDLVIDYLENDQAEIECRECGCKVFVTKTTAEIKQQKSLAAEKEIQYKVNKYNIEPWALNQSAEQSLKELGF